MPQHAQRKPRTIRSQLERAAKTIRALSTLLDELARAARAGALILVWGSFAVTIALSITGHPPTAELLELLEQLAPALPG